MKTYEINGKKYRLPSGLNDFQHQMYIHLINWKWAYLTQEPGYYNRIPYDALLPEKFAAQYYPLYRPIKDRFLEHQQKVPFKSHKFLGHMASSQAACANLFLPILQDPEIAAKVLGVVKQDLKSIAIDVLDGGFRIEFWDEPENMLNDHTKVSGTDADIAIAYFDGQDNLNLWMIEHKLTEANFTTCGGSKSPGRDTTHACAPTIEIIKNNDLCYYHSKRKFRYWDFTLQENSPFDIELISNYDECPFKGGMNQLWRNQLLAAGLENNHTFAWPFKKVYFLLYITQGINFYYQS